jgi:sugar transferase (PEP-CTERM/EpsH1 system associated)
MRVLVLAPQVPWPPRQGTAIRNFHLVRLLAEQHDITLLAFGDPGRGAGPLAAAGVEVIAVAPPPARPMGRRFRDLLSDPVPDLARRLESAAMWSELDALADRGFDVVQIEGFEMAPFGLSVPHVGRPPRRIYDAHNAEWLLQERAWQADVRRPGAWAGAGYSLAQTRKIRRYEAQLLTAVDATIAVSEADAAALQPLAPSATICVVPNGVDTEYYSPADAAAEEDDLCVFTGKMDFRPNVDAMAWFAREVWPRVRAVRPSARLAIVGRDPAPTVQGLVGSGIEVTGAVEDVRPWLSRAAVAVVPLRIGGGTRLKVLEAMAMGKAIAATRLGVEGLAVGDGIEASLADSAADLAAAILALQADPAARRRLGAAARQRVESAYRWEQLVPAIEALYAP